MSRPTELALRSDELEVVLLPELGGRIHRLRAFGTDLLRTPADPAHHAEDPFFWGAYVMAPWCNRAKTGPMTIAGRTVNLPANFDDGSAIHGQVYARPWQVRAEGALHVSGGGDAWPWPYEVIARITADGPTLTCDYRLVNRSDGPMPAGIGLHPWFRRPVALGIPAEAVYPANTESAHDPIPAVGAAHDLRVARVPDSGLDGTWTALAAPHIDLAWARAGIAASIEVEAARVLVAVATPRHLDAVAVEPQTHGPDALRRLEHGEPDAMSLLPPGESLSLTVRITVERVSLSR
jgi:aldose 1-epimerase